MLLEPGRHVWIWARTDRDAPTARDVLDSAAALMWRVLEVRGDRNGTAPNISVELPNNARRYSLGPARPVDVAQLAERPPPMPLAVRHSVEQQPTPFAVQATRTIFVAVDFHWRGPERDLGDEWPRRRVNIFGFPDDEPMELDWLLLDAYHLGEDESDERPDQSQGDLIAESLPTGPQIGVLAIIGALLWLQSRD